MSGYWPRRNNPTTFQDFIILGDGVNSFVFAKIQGWQILGYFTPSGAKVVPKHTEGNRGLDGFKFHYSGWTEDEFGDSAYLRGETRLGDLEPEIRKGCLDVNVLERHELTTEHVLTSIQGTGTYLHPPKQQASLRAHDLSRSHVLVDVGQSVLAIISSKNYPKKLES